MRLLDAQPSSSPPAVLVRDQAIVINLEFLKCIITTGADSLAARNDDGEIGLLDPARAHFVDVAGRCRAHALDAAELSR